MSALMLHCTEPQWWYESTTVLCYYAYLPNPCDHQLFPLCFTLLYARLISPCTTILQSSLAFQHYTPKLRHPDLEPIKHTHARAQRIQGVLREYLRVEEAHRAGAGAAEAALAGVLRTERRLGAVMACKGRPRVTVGAPRRAGVVHGGGPVHGHTAALRQVAVHPPCSTYAPHVAAESPVAHQVQSANDAWQVCWCGECACTLYYPSILKEKKKEDERT
jgi:hypothetical protein